LVTLITGYPGTLGKELVRLFPDSLHPTHAELDIADRDEVNKFFESHGRIDMIIHAAALAGIRACEEKKTTAWQTNVVGTENIIDIATKFNPDCYFVLVSTPCIFDGEDENEKDESYMPNPKGQFYGLTKVLQEKIVSRSGLPNLIVRSNFVARAKYPYNRAFVDRHSYYLYADTLANEIRKLVEKRYEGIVHVQGDRKLSMYELAKLTNPSVEKYTLEEYYKEGNTATLTKNMCIISKRWPVVEFR
jgi:dTDP-4-dehydrorhamnose reductase